jgi:hypothetical protein
MAFQSYVRDWRIQGNDFEDRLSKLSHTSVDSIKKIGLKAEEERVAAMRLISPDCGSFCPID